MSEGKPPETTFQRKLRERKEAEVTEKAATAQAVEKFDSDLIPTEGYERSEADLALDAAVDRVDIIDAYIKYIGKMVPLRRNGQKEGIKISCPNPAHPDKDPSAWINTDKQTWYCAGCAVGGDTFDLAAIGKNLAWPESYKTDGTYRQLRADMAADFGYAAIRLPGGGVIIAEPEAEEHKPDITDTPDNLHTPDNADKSDTDDIPPVASSGELEAEVIDLYDGESELLIPALDWNKLIIEGTFLHEYMKAVQVDDVPLEFHFFHALTALGMALGRDVTLYDSIPIYGNLFICTLGRSGSGKSKAKYHLDSLLSKALPYRHDDPNSKGTKRINSPGSAESLIFNFQKPVMDPTNPKIVAYNAPVRGLIEFNELSALIGRTNRMGSIIKPAMMQFYDMEKNISTSSMTHGVKEAVEPFACAVTSTQPKALKDLLSASDDASGFLNRWTFVLGTTKKRFAIGGTAVTMTPAVAPLEQIFAWAGTFFASEQIQWSNEAAEKFSNFFYTRIELDKERFGSDLIVRIDLLIKKLILLFTANLMLKEVPASCVEQALECYDYLLASYAIPADEIGNTLASEIQTAVINLTMKQFKRNGKGLSMRDISKSLWRRKYPTDLLVKTIEALVKIGYLKLETAKAGDLGRPTLRYKYVD